MPPERRKGVLPTGLLQDLTFSMSGGIGRARKETRGEGNGLQDEADKKSSTQGLLCGCGRKRTALASVTSTWGIRRRPGNLFHGVQTTAEDQFGYCEWVRSCPAGEQICESFRAAGGRLFFVMEFHSEQADQPARENVRSGV